MDTGNKFRKARVLSGLTLHEISNQTNPKISVSQLSLFERNLIVLPKEKIESLAQATNLTILINE